MFCCFRNIWGYNKKMDSIEKLLEDATWGSIDPFTPAVKFGKVIKVYDGDSITIVAKPYDNYPVYRFSVRLNGIDTPELRTKYDNEKRLAIIARDALSEKILGKVVRLENVDSEKYGRLLADIYLDSLSDSENICEWMVKNNHAIEYTGKTKVKPKEWLE